MQNKSAISCAGAVGKGMMVWGAREREGLRVNKRWGLSVGSPKSDTFHHVGGGQRFGVHARTHKYTGQVYLHKQTHTHTLNFCWKHPRRKRTLSKRTEEHAEGDCLFCRGLLSGVFVFFLFMCVCVCVLIDSLYSANIIYADISQS